MPGISLDDITGIFKFYGKSCPINAHEFYEPILEWIDNYMKDPKESTVAEFYLSYFNTVSAKNILKIMNKFENLAKSGKHATIRWMYNEKDEIIKDAGKDFETIVDVKFEFVAILNKEDDLDEEEGFLT
jgi:hypothetical protein